MDLRIDYRSYGGKKFRPITQVDYEKSNGLLLCVTAWGPSEIVSKVTESIKTYISMAGEDTEATMLYQRKENLHTLGNTLRMATIMASEKIYNEFNKEEYTTGFEIFAAIHDGPQWIFVSCGQPALVLCRQNMGVIPITQSLDLNILTTRNRILDPLPNHLLGLGQHPPIQYGNIRLKASDKMALVSRTYLPQDFFSQSYETFDLPHLSKVLAQENLEVPFWMAFIESN